jgi:hypothetical protein
MLMSAAAVLCWSWFASSNAVGDEEPLKGLVTAVAGDQRPFRVVKTQFSEDGSEVTVTFQSEMGIFAFNLAPLPEKLKTVRFIIQKQQYCEGFTLWPKDGKQLDLLRAAGVEVRKQDADLVIEVSGHAFASLKSGGKIQFINQYR